MMIRFSCLVLIFGTTAHAQQWVPSLATTASLRTGGASLVSSDTATRQGGELVLITYWEAKKDTAFDVYRCIDVVDVSFSSSGQECWRIRKPTGRGPVVVGPAASSNDICGRPDNIGGISAAAYCSFSAPFELRTPYFELMVEPLDDGGLIAVTEGGRAVFLTSPPWPSSEFFSVTAEEKAGRAFFADVAATQDIVNLQDGKSRCGLEEIAARSWAVCRSDTSPDIRSYYRIDGQILFEVSYSVDIPARARERVDRIFRSLKLL